MNLWRQPDAEFDATTSEIFASSTTLRVNETCVLFKLASIIKNRTEETWRVVLLEKEDGSHQDHQQSRPVGSDEVGGVASVLVATAVLDEDVESAGALEAVCALFLDTAQPAATPNETIVVPHCTNRKDPG